MTKFLNLTPHPLTIHTSFGEETVLPSGTVARVATVESPRGDSITGAPVMIRRFGAVEGLMSPEPGVVFLVSSLVLGAMEATGHGRGRLDVLAPDTGPTALRHEDGPQKGQVRAVTRLIAPNWD